MPRKPTRLVVGFNGEDRELFSVKEKPDGGLTIKVPSPSLHLNSTWHEVSHRYSVHASLGSYDGGFQVHQTVVYSDGESSDSYAYVKPNAGAAMLHMFGLVPPSFFDARSLAGRPTKNIIRVYDDIPDKALFYVVVVARSPLSESDLPKGLTVTRVPFERYTLFVCSGFFDARANSGAISCPVMSMPPRINGVVSTEDWPVPFEPLSPLPHQIGWLVEQLVDRLAEGAKSVLNRVIDEKGKALSPENLKWTEEGYDLYSSDPHGTRVTNRLLARAARLAHPPSGLWLPPNGLGGAPSLPGLPSKAPGH